MDTGIIALIGALGGTLLGFGLNELSYLLRCSRMDKRLLREALFNLLNLHHYTAPKELGPLISELEQWLKSQGSLSEPIPSSEQLSEALRLIIVPLVEPLREEAMVSLCGTYEQAVAKIAAIDPLLAFSLSGRSRAKSDMQRYLDSVQTLFEPEPTAVEGEAEMLRMLTAARDVSDSQLRSLLEDDIKAVAKRIGIGMRISVKRHLKRANAELNPEDRKRLRILLDKMVPKTKMA
ncbi:MAG: hypothetical protein GY867_05505 [bacterium]|nr:hypothetical protein [bacterium]